jgi:hypothetical protein
MRLEPLPPELEYFVRCAADGDFVTGIVEFDGGTRDIREFVVSWAAVYLTGDQHDQEYALECLWYVFTIVNARIAQELN